MEVAVVQSADDDCGEDSGSTRTCVGCRERAPREALLRFVTVEEAPWILPDPKGKLPGRGVHAHPARSCVRLAAKRGGFLKAMEPAVRSAVTLDGDNISDMAAQSYERSLQGYLLAASRSRKLAVGTEAVRVAVTARKVAVLVVAEDAEGRREDLEQATENLGRRHVSWGTKASLGRIFSRDELGVLGILDSGIGKQFVESARRYAALRTAEAQ